MAALAQNTTTGGASVTKRLQKELMTLMTDGVPGVSAFPSSDSIFEWIGTINGTKGTPYDGMSFKLNMKFPQDYPYSAPTIKFTTPCWHPNVDAAGNICLDILKEKWSAAYSVKTILLSLQTLLGESSFLLLRSFSCSLRRSQQRQPPQHAGGAALGRRGQVPLRPQGKVRPRHRQLISASLFFCSCGVTSVG